MEAIASLTTRDDNVPQLFVENLLEVHKTNLNLIKEVFNGDQSFIGALDKACAAVINHRHNVKLPCRSPELLARYCDGLLKKTGKGPQKDLPINFSIRFIVFLLVLVLF